MVHSTANPEADAEAHFAYWDGALRNSSAHIVVDWDTAVTLLPWQPGRAEKAWNAGPTANRLFLSLEICETDDPVKFQRVWDKAVDVTEQVLRAYRQTTAWLLTHGEASQIFGETNHDDPLPFFSRFSRAWADFVAAVDRLLRGLPAPQPAQPQRKPVAILDASGRKLADGWLDGNVTVAPVRKLANTMGLTVEAGGDHVVLRWPLAR